MKKTGKKKKIVLGIVFGIVAAIIIFGLSFVLMGQGKIKEMEIQNVLIADMPDGAYTGSFVGYRWSNTLEVTVSGGKISDIKILEDQGVAVPDVCKELFDSVQEHQSLQVDAVSGATVSSKAYLKAMENALTGE